MHHIVEISKHIDSILQEICKKSPNIKQEHAMVLGLFSITAERQNIQSEQDKFTKDLSEKADILSGLFE